MKVINLFLLLTLLLFTSSIHAQFNCDDDTTAPIAICNAQLAVFVDAGLTTFLFPADIDDGSFDNCSAVSLSFSEDGSIEFIEISEQTASPTAMTIYATDESGNQSACWGDVFINTQDCSNDTQVPTPYCTNGVTIVLGEDNTASIFTSDIDAGSFDNCAVNVSLSFSEDTNHTSLTVTETGTVPISLWVTDTNNNQDFCETFVTVQPFGSSASISGQVRTHLGDGVPSVKIIAKINGTNVIAGETTTDANGHYTLIGLADNETYHIETQKDAQALNGVSTFDMVVVRRHIVGVTPIATPFAMLAADVNSSNTITTFDMVVSRRLILGLIENFGDTPSWRFFRSTIQFSNSHNPFSLGTVTGNSFEVQLDGDNANGIDFIGVKMGDVNNSVILNP